MPTNKTQDVRPSWTSSPVNAKYGIMESWMPTLTLSQLMDTFSICDHLGHACTRLPLLEPTNRATRYKPCQTYVQLQHHTHRLIQISRNWGSYQHSPPAPKYCPQHPLTNIIKHYWQMQTRTPSTY